MKKIVHTKNYKNPPSKLITVNVKHIVKSCIKNNHKFIYNNNIYIRHNEQCINLISQEAILYKELDENLIEGIFNNDNKLTIIKIKEN